MFDIDEGDEDADQSFVAIPKKEEKKKAS